MRKEVRIESSDYAYLGRVLLCLFLSCITVKIRNVCKLEADCSVMVSMRMNPAIRLYWVICLAARHHQTSGHQRSYEPFQTTVSTGVTTESLCHNRFAHVNGTGGKKYDTSL